ncbi:MAG: peptide deformylase [Ignavibacteriaceae bacterium]|jgi:peptide deformylase
MKKYELKIYPDPVLRKIALPVNKIDHVTRHLLKNMSEIMYAHRAIGLAAPQVGASKRVVITDIGEGLILMINPEILSGFGEEQMEEGCLSLPDTTVKVSRIETLFVRYLDQNEKGKEREFKGLAARVIQHEVDHLNGVLIIDHGRLID